MRMEIGARLLRTAVKTCAAAAVEVRTKGFAFRENQRVYANAKGGAIPRAIQVTVPIGKCIALMYMGNVGVPSSMVPPAQATHASALVKDTVCKGISRNLQTHGRRMFQLASFAIGLLAMNVTFDANAQPPIERSLFGSTPTSERTEACSSDPLLLARVDSVRGAIAQLRLDGSRVIFTGCRKAPFMTTVRPGIRAADLRYVIYYPLGLKADEYVAPIAHELAHVFQIESAGGFDALKRSLSSARIELGADFVVGLVASRSGIISRPMFQHSVHLIGRYREEAAQAHGSPEQRVSAFRFGYFLATGRESSIETSHQFFQDELAYEIGIEIQ